MAGRGRRRCMTRIIAAKRGTNPKAIDDNLYSNLNSPIDDRLPGRAAVGGHVCI